MIQDLETLATTFLSCLCQAVTGQSDPPKHCCLRVGEEVVHDADLFVDLCCEGLAYVSVGDIYPVVDSFPEQSVVTQANQVCSFPSWAVTLKAGIVRCAPTGTDTTMPTCDDWTAAAVQSMEDAQSLATAACCLKSAWAVTQPGMSIVINPNTVTGPEGGCLERSVTVQVQVPNCPGC
jgi:hypothetical protein